MIALIILIILYIIISFFNLFKGGASDHGRAEQEVRVQTSLTTRIIFSVVFIPLIFGYAKSFIELLYKVQLSDPLVFFAIGFVVYCIIWHLLGFNARGRGDIYATFEHEFTHVVVGLLFFHKPSAFMASNRGGVTSYNRRVNFAVKLAPYFLLTFSLFLLPVYYLLKPSIHNIYFVVLGILTSYHTFSTVKETGFWQTDITTTGKFFSVVVIILGSIVNYGIILAFVLGRMPLLQDFLISGFNNVYSLLNLI